MPMTSCVPKNTHGVLLAGAKRAALYVGWSQARHGTEPRARLPNTKLSITRSFFELQSPDFAWKSKCQNVKMSKCQNVKMYSPASAINTQKEKKARNTRNTKKTKIPKISKIPKKLSGASY